MAEQFSLFVPGLVAFFAGLARELAPLFRFFVPLHTAVCADVHTPVHLAVPQLIPDAEMVAVITEHAPIAARWQDVATQLDATHLVTATVGTLDGRSEYPVSDDHLQAVQEAAQRDTDRVKAAKRATTTTKRAAARTARKRAADVAAFTAALDTVEFADNVYNFVGIDANLPADSAEGQLHRTTNGLNRKQIQALAKQHGIKANLKTSEILQKLLGNV